MCAPQDPTAYPQPSSQDLAGFWDLLQLAMEDVRVKFQHLQRIKDSGWRLPPDKKVRRMRECHSGYMRKSRTEHNHLRRNLWKRWQTNRTLKAKMAACKMDVQIMSQTPPTTLFLYSY